MKMFEALMALQQELEKQNNKKEAIMQQNQRNNKSESKTLLESIKFSELGKSNGISISNDGKLIVNRKDGLNHCYLNLKMESGVYYINFKYQGTGMKSCDFENDYYTSQEYVSTFTNRLELAIGLSTDNTYYGDDIHNQSTTCSYDSLFTGKFYSICHIGRVVKDNLNFNNADGSEYEMIVDMNKREFWISHNYSSPALFIKDLPSPLYPFIAIASENSTIDLLSVSHHN